MRSTRHRCARRAEQGQRSSRPQTPALAAERPALDRPSRRSRRRGAPWRDDERTRESPSGARRSPPRRRALAERRGRRRRRLDRSARATLRTVAHGIAEGARDRAGADATERGPCPGRRGSRRPRHAAGAGRGNSTPASRDLDEVARGGRRAGSALGRRGGRAAPRPRLARRPGFARGRARRGARGARAAAEGVACADAEAAFVARRRNACGARTGGPRARRATTPRGVAPPARWPRGAVPPMPRGPRGQGRRRSVRTAASRADDAARSAWTKPPSHGDTAALVGKALVGGGASPSAAAGALVGSGSFGAGAVGSSCGAARDRRRLGPAR